MTEAAAGVDGGGVRVVAGEDPEEMARRRKPRPGRVARAKAAVQRDPEAASASRKFH
jgi:hypothetical protein